MSAPETLTSEKRKCGNGVPRQQQRGVFSRHARLQLPRLRELKAKIAALSERESGQAGDCKSLNHPIAQSLNESNLRIEEGSSAGAVEQPSELFEAASQRSEMEGRARSAEFSFFIDEEELAQ